MMEKQDFMELLSEIRDYQKTQPEPMTREEIRDYFDGIELNDAQIEMICDYLKESGKETVQSPEGKEEPADDPDACETKEEASTEDQQYVEIYLEELSYLKAVSLEEKRQHFQVLCGESEEGRERAKEILVSAYLASVIPIAKEYTGKGMYLSDLIQEGNLGLMDALETFETAGIKVEESIHEAEEYVKRCVREAMLSVLNEQRMDKDKESEFVAKTALIYEAKKALAQENGRSATLEELSEYTRIPIEEIMDIERLAKED